MIRVGTNVANIDHPKDLFVFDYQLRSWLHVNRYISCFISNLN